MQNPRECYHPAALSDRQRVLVVEDDEDIGVVLTGLLGRGGLEARHVASAEAAVTALDSGSFDAVLTDLKLPGMDGLALLRHVHERWSDVPVVMLTAFGSVPVAVEAMRAGAADFMLKPFDREEVLHTVQRALHAYAARAERPPEPVGLVGRSEPLRAVRADLLRAARVQSTVLIRGESGTGKELIARAVHRESPRRYFSLISVNCGALPESLLESELFGHEKGAFTGALYRRKGKLELADGGTIFLDEVATLTPKSQVDLLRVLETHELNRLGGHETIKVDFRVVCATNEDLEALVADKRFREDLYYRLNVFTIEAPPLRNRVSDIPLLAEHFLRRAAPTVGRNLTGFSPEALERLCAHTWPGNVRELANAVERAAIVAAGPRVELHDLPPLNGGGHPAAQGSLEDVERQHIQRVLDEHDGNITRSARALEVDRATLYNKIKKYELRR
ncbi:MAG: sigma-54-dependent Fis family transcriptional regulator [Myxococcales bacterium]|nr:sigma-54-dependent Fis family transcriptional regulator [Myxococcales bacterium]